MLLNVLIHQSSARPSLLCTFIVLIVIMLKRIYKCFCGCSLLCTFIVLIVMATCCSARVNAGEAPNPLAKPRTLPAPSSHQGKAGTYKATTSYPQYNYYVCVPASCVNKPVGVHVYLHGFGGQGKAQNFTLWGPLLTKGELIGINMEYTDGNPHDDMLAKADAAREAIAQVAADYKIILGRGAITAFSAGGSPAGCYVNMGKTATSHGLDWPFSQVNVFGSALNVGVERTKLPTSWYRAMGDGEESLVPGATAQFVQHTLDALTDTSPMACPDVYLSITKGRGHTILPSEVVQAADNFVRSALFIAPYIYEPDFAEPALATIVQKANHLRQGEALAEAIACNHAKAPALKNLIEGHVREQVAAITALSAKDPVLAWAYGDIIRKQFVNHTAQLKIIDAALAPLAKDGAKWTAIRTSWSEKLGTSFNGPRIKPTAEQFLNEIVKNAGATSTLGTQAKRFLTLK